MFSCRFALKLAPTPEIFRAWMWYDFFRVMRMETHDYTWKIGLQFSSRTKLRTNKPLTENTVLIDLYDGHRYVVQAICPAKPRDKEWDFLPDTVVHTCPWVRCPRMN
jgi:hypothetical protein